MAWKNRKGRKPLILTGARQVGKTFTIKEFAKTFPSNVYINFEEDEQLIAIFKKNLNPSRILSELSLHLETSIDP